MILTGQQIAAEVAAGRINITPFNPSHITPSSYDLTLGADFVRYHDGIIDPAQPPKFEKLAVGADGLRLQAGDFVLGHSVEVVGSDHYAALIHARSSTARLGLFVHVTSDLIHTGALGQITFQLYATLPVTIKPGTPIGQITFWQPKGEITLYRGKYYNQQGVMPSALHTEF